MKELLSSALSQVNNLAKTVKEIRETDDITEQQDKLMKASLTIIELKNQIVKLQNAHESRCKADDNIDDNLKLGKGRR